MDNIIKVSDIGYTQIAEYLRLNELTQDDITALNNLIDIAKAYIQQYTGLSSAEIDNYSDLVIVVYVLVQDMYDNRTMYIDKNNVNRVVDSILNLHQVNLL